VFARVLLNRMQDAVDQLLRQQQAGFRCGSSCIDQIFTLGQILEKVTEGQRPLIVNFIDFRKDSTAFTDQHYGKSLSYRGYQRKSSPSPRHSMQRATVQSELMVTQAAPLVLGGDGSSPRVHSIATAACNCDGLGAMQDH